MPKSLVRNIPLALLVILAVVAMLWAVRMIVTHRKHPPVSPGPHPYSGVAVFRAGNWIVDAERSPGLDESSLPRVFQFGLPDDFPIVGDWDGSGKRRIGVFRKGDWYVDANGNNTWDGQPADKILHFGLANDVPVVGDWD